MTGTYFRLAAGSAVVAGILIICVFEHETKQQLRTENESLRSEIRQLASLAQERVLRQTNPAKPANASGAIPPANAAPAEPVPRNPNLYFLVTNKTSRLAREQLEPYLAENHRNAASLLAAFRTCEDTALLEEALQRFPKDPHVAFEAAIRKDPGVGDRRQWLDAFKQTAPDNALADYLSAADHLKAGRTDQALQDLMAASGKAAFQDYSFDRMQESEEAYRAAGYSMAESTVLANSHLLLPQLAQMRDLGKGIVDLAKSYQQSGDEISRQGALEMAVNLGRRYGDAGSGELLIGQLVGVAIERTALGAMDPDSSYSGGGTGKDRLEQLAQQRSQIKELAKQAEPFWENMSDHDWISYHSRSAMFGEQNAMRWLVSKYGQN